MWITMLITDVDNYVDKKKVTGGKELKPGYLQSSRRKELRLELLSLINVELIGFEPISLINIQMFCQLNYNPCGERTLSDEYYVVKHRISYEGSSLRAGFRNCP